LSIEEEKHVNPILQTLIELQQVDSVIFDIQQRLDEFPKLLQRLDQQLAEHEESLATVQKRLEEQEKLRRSKELDVESRQAQIKKYQSQLLQVKTNKEYSALLTEINGLKTKNSLTEDDILELMESIERARKAIVDAEKEAEKEKVKVAEVKEAKHAEQAELGRDLAKNQAQREEIAADVEGKVLNEYTKLLKLRNGVAVIAVEDEGVCLGCHVAVTPQMFAEIKSGDFLHRCPTCFRFLYWTDHANTPDGEEAME
jgi:predicted  nucleic acid-binding Zn-ribbon protein